MDFGFETAAAGAPSEFRPCSRLFLSLCVIRVSVNLRDLFVRGVRLEETMEATTKTRLKLLAERRRRQTKTHPARRR